jgi:hypothetical protein
MRGKQEGKWEIMANTYTSRKVGEDDIWRERLEFGGQEQHIM